MRLIELFKKYGFHVISILLFVFLIVYAVRYLPIAWNFIKTLNTFLVIVIFLILVAIILLCSVRWLLLMKIFNDKMDKKKLVFAYLASNLYKYIPPKGINYIVRNRYVRSLPGRISTMFGELFTEIYISAIFFAIMLLVFVKENAIVNWAVVASLFMLTLGLLFPNVIVWILDKFPVKIKKFRKLFTQFMIIRKSGWFYLAMFFTFMSAMMHGLATYLLVINVIPSGVGFIHITLIFYSAQFLSLLLMAPGGIGVRDLTIVGLLSSIGMPVSLAVIVSLAYRVLMFLSELGPGFVSIALLKKY